MTRKQRLDLVQRVAEDFERRKAEALATSERRVSESEAKLAELEAYRTTYIHDFTTRAGSGINAASAREYQVFLARLDEALLQQKQIVVRARTLRDTERQSWQGAAQRAEVVAQVVQRWTAEEERRVEHREQRESDERSQRLWAQGLHSRGH